MDSVNHFEIPCDDVERAKKFYQTVFNWKTMEMEGMEDYTFASTAEVDEQGNVTQPGAINGGMMKREGPFNGPTFAITVDSIDDRVKQIEANGGEIVIPKQAVGNMGYTAYFKDSEGNLLGMWETA